jgi:hypothetical protein
MSTAAPVLIAAYLYPDKVPAYLLHTDFGLSTCHTLCFVTDQVCESGSSGRLTLRTVEMKKKNYFITEH